MYRLQPLFDRKKLKIFIRKYEEGPPLSFYLNRICEVFEHVSDILHPVRKRILWPSVYPDFVLERIQFVTGSSTNFGLRIEWPLDVYVKLFSGSFRRYDYVNTLQVGIEQDTSRVPLH